MLKLNVGDLVVISFEPGMEWLDSSTVGRADSRGYAQAIGIVVSENVGSGGKDLSYGRSYNYVYRYRFFYPYAWGIAKRMKRIEYTGECNIQNRYVTKLNRFQHLHHNIRQIFKLGLIMSDNKACREIVKKI
jgi:hypothetical protein